MKAVARVKWLIIALQVMILLFIVQSCTKEKIIIYRPNTDQVNLLSPPNTDLVFIEMPHLAWEQLSGATSYQVQLATSDAFSDIIANEIVSDTSFVYGGSLDNARYYWRVRAKNSDEVWGDWSEALIWSFSINDNTNYMVLLSLTPTFGIAQDVFVVEERPDSVIAYVADGQAGMTIVNVTDPENPRMVGNIDHPNGNFGQSVWKLPGDEIAYMADLDGKIAALDTRLPLDVNSVRDVNLGFQQNLTDLCGMVFQDTIYMFTANSGFGHQDVNFFQIVYRSGIPGFGDLYIVPEARLPSDGEGVFFDTMSVVVEYYDSVTQSTHYENQEGMFVFAAVDQAGLWWYDVSATHTFDGADTLVLRSPRLLGSGDTPSSALAVFTSNGYAYVADDRGGLQIFDLPDTIPAFDHDNPVAANPALVASINTSGRTKDVYVAGNYCYMADGSGGLKIIDITNPQAPAFLAAYGTPYAYGVFVGQDYIYICDRDNGLMVFAKGDLIN